MARMIVGGSLPTITNNVLYVGGLFATYKGTEVSRSIALNTDGTQYTTFNVGSGFGTGSVFVTEVLIDSNNKIYFAGGFTSYQGSEANRIIRLNSDGTKDTGFDNSIGFNGQVNSMALDSNGKLYLGGSFTSYKGNTENKIIRLNPDGTKDTGFDNTTGFVGDVFTLTIDSNGKIYVGGSFTSYKGTAANGIIRLNSDGTKDTGFDNTTGFVGFVEEVILDSNNKLYVGGGFTSYKGTAANGIIRLNTDGTKDTAFDNTTGFSGGSVFNFALDSNGKIYAGGNFTSYKGVTANSIIRLNTDGTKDTAFDNTTGFNAFVRYITIDSNGKIYVVGGFTTYKGATENYIVRLNADGTKDTAFDNSTGFNNQTRVIKTGSIVIPSGVQSHITISASGQKQIRGNPSSEKLIVYQEVFQNPGTVYVNYTEAAASATVGDVAGPFFYNDQPFNPIQTADLYIGYEVPFDALTIKVNSLGTPGTISYFIRDNSGFTPLTVNQTVANLSDLETTTEGKVYWSMPSKWSLYKTSFHPDPLYWIMLSQAIGDPNAFPPGISYILKTTPP